MNRKKIGLIILDGLGYNKKKVGNAFIAANTPTIDNLLKKYPHCILQASGKSIGLPCNQMGNSEIGHLNIGAGRTIKSELTRINDEIRKNKIEKNKNLLNLIKFVKLKKNIKLHLIGLCSNGGVHSELNHILKLLEILGNNKINTILHCISDGRDTATKIFIKDLAIIINKIKNYPSIKIGTISGRYYAMDRNQNWNRILKTINAMLKKGKNFVDPIKYVYQSYKKKITDEFIEPAFNSTLMKSKLEKNDIFFFANFRPDRARQICHLIKKTNLYSIKSNLWNLNLFLTTMVKYDGVGADDIIFPPIKYQNTLGEIIEKNNLKQLRIAETEKYAHVTFFLDGGKEIKYKNEKKILVPSPNVTTYDKKPQMSANEICKQLLLNMNKYDIFICNFANCDMVGHTGNWNATIKAVETIDNCLKQIIIKATKTKTTLFITADHGNCDLMIDKNNNPITTHSLSPVFFIITDNKIKKLKNGSIANIAPTILKYVKITQPKEMDKKPLY